MTHDPKVSKSIKKNIKKKKMAHICTNRKKYSKTWTNKQKNTKLSYSAQKSTKIQKTKLLQNMFTESSQTV